jgi:hypothetical protein
MPERNAHHLFWYTRARQSERTTRCAMTRTFRESVHTLRVVRDGRHLGKHLGNWNNEHSMLYSESVIFTEFDFPS